MVLLHLPCQRIQVARPHMAWCARPLLECCARRCNCLFGLLGAGLGYTRQWLTIGWVDALEQPIVGWRSPAPTDELPKAPIVGIQPCQRRAGALGGRPVLHGLKDIDDL